MQPLAGEYSISDCGLRVIWLRIADFEKHINDCGLRIADCGLRIADFEKQVEIRSIT
jgi:hypothetical protein